MSDAQCDAAKSELATLINEHNELRRMIVEASQQLAQKKVVLLQKSQSCFHLCTENMRKRLSDLDYPISLIADAAIKREMKRRSKQLKQRLEQLQLPPSANLRPSIELQEEVATFNVDVNSAPKNKPTRTGAMSRR